jgi:hypothetical protein
MHMKKQGLIGKSGDLHEIAGQLGRCTAGRRRTRNPRVGGKRGKPSGGRRATQKMLKTKVDPEMYMKTKDRPTLCPT